MNEKLLNTIDSIQKSLFYTFVLLVPIVFVPLPWDISEKPLGLLLIIFAAALLALEMVRLINRGVLYYTKSSLDFPSLLFILFALIGSFFSVSYKTSFFGYENRLGSGSLILALLFFFTYITRSFIKTKEDITNTIFFFVTGLSIGSILNLLSMWGLDMFTSIPFINNLFDSGLSIYSSTRIAIVLSLVGSILSIYLLSTYYSAKRFIPAIFLSFLLVPLVLSTLTYTLALSTAYVFICLVVILVFLLISLFIKSEKHLLQTILLSILLFLYSIATLFVTIPQLRESITFLDEKIVKQVVIDTDTSWKISTSVYSNSIFRTLIGSGYDTFNLTYNLYREMSNQPQLMLLTSYTYASNNVLNILSNLGIIGFLLWIYIGFNILKYTYTRIKEKLLLKDFSDYVYTFILVIYIFSFFAHFSFILYFVFFLLLMLHTVIYGLEQKKKSDAFVLSMSFFVHNPEKQKKEQNNGIIYGVIALSMLVVSLIVIRQYTAMYYAMAGESSYVEYIKTSNEKINDREKSIKESLANYERAVNMDSNDIYNRRIATVISDYIGVLVFKYSESSEDVDKERLVQDISSLSEIAIEYARRSTEINPTVYNNWRERSDVYSKLVGYGLTVHTRSTIAAIQEALKLNPLNYELYYTAGQLYLINNEDNSAKSALKLVLNINSNHVPSLMLLGEISIKEKKYEEAYETMSAALYIVKSIDPENGLGVLEYLEKKLNDIEPLVKIRGGDQNKEDKKEEKDTAEESKEEEKAEDNTQTTTP